MDLKWIALIALVIQNSGLALMMRYTMLASTPETRYLASTAVLLSEVLKFFISVSCCFLFDASRSWTQFKSILYEELIVDKYIWVKLAIPSVLYTLQNLLQYFSMSLLSAPVFQVLYQMKIITTALFSVIILAKYINTYQWTSVAALTAGVALVQLSQLQHSDSKPNSFLGLISVLCGCLTSGFAGVYFEMVLKSSKASIWVRNIQLAVIGGFLSGLACYFRDGDFLSEHGFFYGYSSSVLGVIFLQAAGGMIVAVVVKYADNVLKGFATSLSILLSCIVSSLLFHDVNFNLAFNIGSLIVIGSVFGYGYNPPLPTGTKPTST